MDKWFPYVLVAFAVLWFLGRNFFGPGEDQIREFLDKDPLLVDVRSPAEFARGHAEGAINIPVGQGGKRLEEFGAKDSPVAVYCKSGGRSARAASELSSAGFTDVMNLGGVGQVKDAMKK